MEDRKSVVIVVVVVDTHDYGEVVRKKRFFSSFFVWEKVQSFLLYFGRESVSSDLTFRDSIDGRW